MKRIYFLLLFSAAVGTVYSQNKTSGMNSFTISAKPQPVTIDPAHTALIIVDMQNDFGAKGGMFDRAGIDISMIRKVIAPISNVLALARKLKLPVIYLKMGFKPDLSDLGNEGSTNRTRHLRMGVGDTIVTADGTKSRILIRDTWNTDIVTELKPQPNETVIYKHRFSGFYKTELDSVLKKLNISQLIFTGCTTSVCVESTVRDAMFRDYACVVLADCTAEPIGNDFPRTNHDASLLLIQALFGWVSSSEELIKSIKTEALAIH
jgi:ureidoacrylate peracid hydrolase